MTNDMQIFENPEFGKIRTIEENNKILFCASDVAKALGYTNPRKAVGDHCKGVTKRDTLTSGGKQKVSFIPEGDVYRLITHSKLPNAEKFENWVFDDVLPSIRENGGYIAGQEKMTDAEILANAVLVAQRTIAARDERIAALTAQNTLLAEKNERLTPLAEFSESVIASDTSILIGMLATLLQQNGLDIGQNRLFARLRKEGYLIDQKGDRWNTPTQRAMAMGLFEVDTKLVQLPGCNAGKITYTTRVTPKGQKYFIEKYVFNRDVPSLDMVQVPA